MPKAGDELHHFGWNICSSCHGKPGDRRYLIVPGLKSGRIHVVDAKDPLEPEDAQGHRAGGDREGGRPVGPAHGPLPGQGEIMISMLGDAKGNGPGGFLLLDDKFEPKGRWEKDATGMSFNYDFWYQPRHNVMVSSEWGARNVPARPQLRRRRGRQVRPEDPPLGLEGAEDPPVVRPRRGGHPAGGPLRARPGEAVRVRRRGAQQHHVAIRRRGGRQVLESREGGRTAPVKNDKFPGGTVPALISDFVISMDDRFMYVSAWLHGDVRQYDITDPLKPEADRNGGARRHHAADGEDQGQGTAAAGRR